MIPGGVAVRMRVQIDDDTHDIITNPGDYRAWLRDIRGGEDPRSGDEYTSEDMWYLAWHACRRLELTELELDEFLEGAGKGVLQDLSVPARRTGAR